MEYVTGKSNNVEIIKNVINERNHNKIKSMEEINYGRKRNHCKRKKDKLARVMRNNANGIVSDNFRTMNNSPIKLNDGEAFSRYDIRSTNMSPLNNRREFLSKSPVDMNTLNVTTRNNLSLLPIQPV